MPVAGAGGSGGPRRGIGRVSGNALSLAWLFVAVWEDFTWAAKMQVDGGDEDVMVRVGEKRLGFSGNKSGNKREVLVRSALPPAACRLPIIFDIHVVLVVVK